MYYRGVGLMRGGVGLVGLALDGHWRGFHCLRWTEILHRVCHTKHVNAQEEHKELSYLNLRDFEGICA